eukprot:5114069-Ditylum_brightwellii.AAC.1
MFRPTCIYFSSASLKSIHTSCHLAPIPRPTHGPTIGYTGKESTVLYRMNAAIEGIGVASVAASTPNAFERGVNNI